MGALNISQAPLAPDQRLSFTQAWQHAEAVCADFTEVLRAGDTGMLIGLGRTAMAFTPLEGSDWPGTMADEVRKEAVRRFPNVPFPAKIAEVIEVLETIN